MDSRSSNSFGLESWSGIYFLFHPGAEDRDEIIPGRTHFCPKTCKHSKVNDQTPRWKSSRDEIQVIPGWNSSRDELTHVNGALATCPSHYTRCEWQWEAWGRMIVVDDLETTTTTTTTTMSIRLLTSYVVWGCPAYPSQRLMYKTNDGKKNMKYKSLQWLKQYF